SAAASSTASLRCRPPKPGSPPRKRARCARSPASSASRTASTWRRAPRGLSTARCCAACGAAEAEAAGRAALLVGEDDGERDLEAGQQRRRQRIVVAQRQQLRPAVATVHEAED